jgi:hypothetical protein
MLLLAACGSDKDSSSSSSSNSSSKGCDSASASTVNSALGTNYGDPQVTSQDDVDVCTYTDSTTQLTGIIRFQKSTTHELFDVARQGMDSSGQKTTDLDGVGDEAYSSTFKASSLVPELNTVVARKGSKEVLITASASIDKEKDLANKLLG